MNSVHEDPIFGCLFCSELNSSNNGFHLGARWHYGVQPVLQVMIERYLAYAVIAGSKVFCEARGVCFVFSSSLHGGRLGVDLTDSKADDARSWVE